MHGMRSRIVIDLETTGLDSANDEILTLSICDIDGTEIYDRMFKPQRTTEWPEAEAVNDISPEMVATCPPIADHVAEIQKIMDDAAEVFIYNAHFDSAFLEAAGIHVDPSKIEDTMIGFAAAYGEWNENYGDYRWQRLTTAAAHVGHEWTGRAHGSLADARATAAVQRWLNARRISDDA